MRLLRTLTLGGIAAVSLLVMSAGAPARADWHGHGGGWHDGWRGPGVVVGVGPGYYAPPPAYYYAPPPPVVYAPPPAYYAPPPPVYLAPPVALGLNFRIR